MSKDSRYRNFFLKKTCSKTIMCYMIWWLIVKQNNSAEWFHADSQSGVFIICKLLPNRTNRKSDLQQLIIMDGWVWLVFTLGKNNWVYLIVAGISGAVSETQCDLSHIIWHHKTQLLLYFFLNNNNYYFSHHWNLI